MHVHIQGETEEQVAKAEKEIRIMLNPDSLEHQEHKAKQLKELQVLNGTVRSDDKCFLCGQSGHHQSECPDRLLQMKAAVKCGICGDGSHPTHDCPLRAVGGPIPQRDAQSLQSEYDNFMKEMEMGTGGSAPMA